MNTKRRSRTTYSPGVTPRISATLSSALAIEAESRRISDDSFSQSLTSVSNLKAESLRPRDRAKIPLPFFPTTIPRSSSIVSALRTVIGLTPNSVHS